jgi:hypothetical protein
MRQRTCSHRCAFLRAKFQDNMSRGIKIRQELIPYKFKEMFVKCPSV